MRRALMLASVVVLTVAGVTLAGATQFPQRDPEFPQRDYTCRLDGSDVPLGARRCLKTPQGQQVAECGIALNMSTWRPGDGVCP